MSQENSKATYACLNFNEAFCPKQIEKQSICIDGDAGDLIAALKWVAEIAMKQMSNKEYEKYRQYQTGKLRGWILTPDGLRVLCTGLDNDPEKTSLHSHDRKKLHPFLPMQVSEEAP